MSEDWEHDHSGGIDVHQCPYSRTCYSVKRWYLLTGLVAGSAMGFILTMIICPLIISL